MPAPAVAPMVALSPSPAASSTRKSAKGRIEERLACLVLPLPVVGSSHGTPARPPRATMVPALLARVKFKHPETCRQVPRIVWERYLA